MMREIILPERGTCLRLNHLKILRISIPHKALKYVFIINGNSFLTENVTNSHLIINPKAYYMIINKGKNEIEISYNIDISNHHIIYNPYQYELSEKVNFNPEEIKKQYPIPEGYIDFLAKWYSIKFTYPQYNLIFIRPELGISIQIHKFRNEFWEIIDGKPIIINGNKVHYFVDKGVKFENVKGTYHGVINPNKNPDKFVIIKESWTGNFDENDITRLFNPNNYQ